MINRKDFEEGNFKTYRGASLKVIEFLKTNKDSAYTSKEIAENVGASQASVSITLRNLVKTNLVENKKPYYILKSGTSPKKKSTKKEETEKENAEITEEE